MRDTDSGITVYGMPRENQSGKDIRRVLEWLLAREIPDTEIGAALEYPTSTFGRRKIADDYPTFEELQQIGKAFRISPMMLQIAFGLLDRRALTLLDEGTLRQYVEQGGHLPDDINKAHAKKRGLSARPDAEPL